MSSGFLRLFYLLFAALYGLLTAAAWLAVIGAAVQREPLVAVLFLVVAALAGALVAEALRQARQAQ